MFYYTYVFFLFKKNAKQDIGTYINEQVMTILIIAHYATKKSLYI